MAKHTPFGKEVLKWLIDKDLSSNWLAKQVQERTGLYFDAPMLSKLLSGRQEDRKFEDAIKAIMNTSKEDHK